MANWTDVARILQRLEHTERDADARTWRAGGKLLAWERPLRRSDLEALGDTAPKGPILGVRVPLEVKDTLLEDEPDVYFTTPHFNGYPAILVRLSVITAAALRELLTNAWGVRDLVRRPPRTRKKAPTGKKAPTRKKTATRKK